MRKNVIINKLSFLYITLFSILMQVPILRYICLGFADISEYIAESNNTRIRTVLLKQSVYRIQTSSTRALLKSLSVYQCNIETLFQKMKS